MKRRFRKLTALILSLAVVVGCGVFPTFAENAEDAAGRENTDSFRGAFYYSASSGSGDAVDYYTYSDSWFHTPSTEYNIHLATMSMAVAEASAGSSREAFNAAGYSNMSRNIIAILEDIGFSDIAVNDAYRKKPTKDSVGAACAHKQLVENGRRCTLLAIMPRSAGYGAELGGNYLIGASGDAAGYSAAAEKVLTFVRSYISDHGLNGDIKVWTSGYDRGAAIVDLVAKKLIDDPKKALGTAVTLSAADLYAYAFGSPNAADLKQKPDSEKYRMIYHHITDTDIFSAIPSPEMGLSRYGTVKVINSKAKKARMKQLLAVCDPAVYADYISSNDPDLFKTKRVTSSFSVVNDTNSYIPSDLSEYLRGEGKYLAQFNGGRAGYTTGAEKPLSNLLAYYGSLTPEKADAFTASLAGNKDTVNEIFSMYAYFMRLKATGTASTSAWEPERSKELAAVAALSDASSDFSEKELYELMLRMVGYMRSSPDTILNDSAKYLKSILTSAMQASGASSAQISSLTAANDMKTLSRFLSYLLFGNIWQSKEVDPYDFSNEQIKNAVTLLENAELLLNNHQSELLISWLRADDSHYDDYASLTAAQSAGYRRVFLSSSDNAPINGTVCGQSGERLAEIKDGALVDSTDPWLGYTATDEGGFIRVPMGEDYRIMLSPDGETTLDVTIKEYDCAKAQAVTALEETRNVADNAVVTVALPAVESTSVPTGAAYTVTVTQEEPMMLLGDANSDGTVTILDVTAIQHTLSDFKAEIIEVLADVDGEDGVTICDATYIQRWLVDIECPYDVGKCVKTAGPSS